MAETFLIKEGYPEDRVKRIVNIIISHSGLYRRKHGDSDIIEAKILYDADRFGWAQSSEGFERYFQMFYLKETKKLLKKKCPELFK